MCSTPCPSLSSNHPRCLRLLHSLTSVSMPHLLQLHAQMLRNHSLFLYPFAAAKLLELFSLSLCANLCYAFSLLTHLPNPNTFSFNTLIKAYANSPSPAPALTIFSLMLRSNTNPNSYTFPFLAKACAHLSSINPGLQIHAHIVKFEGNSRVFSQNGLINMYSTHGNFDEARQVFEEMPHRDLVTWNSMLSGFVNCSLIIDARKVFDEMPQRTIISWNAMLSGYMKSGDVTSAKLLFDQMPSRNVETWNAMVAGYAKCGLVDHALEVFHSMPERNVVSWSAVVSACAQGGHPRKALVLFGEMRDTHVRPNGSAIVSALSACTHLGALDHGRRLHKYLKANWTRLDTIVGTALIDMYAKCGCLEDASSVFQSLGQQKDVFVWTAMIGGLAMNGHGQRALELFGLMEDEGVRPNEVTFIGVLCACSHGGLVERCRRYFTSMSKIYGINPQIEHYGCMVDALGRAGLLDEARAFVEAMPLEANSVLWGTLLGACWIHGNAELGEYVVKHLVELDPKDGGVYVLLSNIYARVGRWEEAKETRKLMQSKGLQKSPGISSIEVDGVVHEFYVGDKSHCRTKEIYAMLEEMASRLKLVGYTPNTSPVLFDIEDEEKEHAISHHSEKLALAFGLVSVGLGVPIRIVKNLRVCLDCHTVMKLISTVYIREIIVRDHNVFHHFKEGLCSCKDYW
ncbi:pentatricopeptide repeat-containing protein At2g29760, chloroplastic-like [Amborella trichopoda]|uniref:pentatricopeptide repeat-containing protein At2g29760, chloroplastic-like n=1 Tax=Amborella trichopoda TaxID=13333 RepID=UPI0009C14A1C|nr:pentatricopeptide repeat-containing protein At2g29760, chloroplastic-like [Amborella trichopoda]XP_020521184.1 pentatricopeptide repeat-containing protein At2g29760, chloroplastic-like [Amborella trichopoda]|eukprot:XP_011622218.2 pentatricopeptide repeat-containing protein At2g29760, chloroplastic-like [Amborella trichopoda]